MTLQSDAIQESIDFAAAAAFLQAAREAHGMGDLVMFAANRKMVAVALGIEEAPPARLQAARLKR